MPRQQWIGLGIALLIGAVFAMIGTYWTCRATALVVNTISVRHEWNRAPGHVVSHRLEKKPGNKTTRYVIRIRYDYVVDGTRYGSDRYSYDDEDPYEREGAENILERYPIGSEISAYVDPDDPATAVLSADFVPLLFPVATSLLFGAVGYGILLIPLYPLHLRNRKRGLAEGRIRPALPALVSFHIAFPIFWCLFTLTIAAYILRHGATLFIVGLVVFGAVALWLLRGTARALHLLWTFGGSRLEFPAYPPRTGAEQPWLLRGIRTSAPPSFSLAYREEAYDSGRHVWEGEDRASTELTASAETDGWRGTVKIPSVREEAVDDEHRRRGWCLAVTKGKRTARYFFRVERGE